MPAERIAANLAYVNWTVLTGLAVGAFAVAFIGRQRTEATRGFLALASFAAALCAVGAYAADTGLPGALAGSPVVADPTWDAPRRVALLAFALLAFGYTVALARRRRSPALGLGALAVGVAAEGFAALSWGGGPAGAILLFVQLLALAAATGGVAAAMVLAHWYLVTPKLPTGPLILFARLLLGVLAVQVVLFVLWTGAGLTAPGAATGGGPFAALTGPWAFFAWMRLLVGLVFPLVVSWMAIQTAKSRSMESATGLLYINVGTIAAGTILAAGLYFGAGLLV